MSPSSFSNKQLLDELTRRLNQDLLSQSKEELARLENEIRQLSTRLQESEKGKSQFLSNIRNEINNPVTSIIGLAASINGISVDEKIRRMSMLIHNQASDLDFQMRNIIVAAEIQMGEVKPSISRVDIVGLIEATVLHLQHRTNQQNVTVQLELPDQLKFCTDAHILQTICLNLLANAIEFSGSNKIAIFEARENSKCLEIVARDFGEGIAPEIQKEMFQRFKQGESGLMKGHGGHGLGMSIVNELLTHLGGSMEVQSTLSEGTTIKVKIPEFTSQGDQMGSSNFGDELLFTVDEKF